MQVVVKLFATLRDRAKAKTVTLQLPPDATVATLRKQLVADYPALIPAMDSCIIAINRQFASPETPVHAGDEIAAFPPVSGGGGPASSFPTVCRITSETLDLDEIVRDLTLLTTGAVVAFVGTVRAAEQDRQVTHLYYEAYEVMAQAKLFQVADEMRGRFPQIEGIALVQRVGRLDASVPTVVVAVSSAHRDQGGFEAARYGIDRIKEIVPVWKKEIGPDREGWIEGHYQPGAGE